MRRDPRLEIITEAIERLIPGATPAFLTVEVQETLPGTANPDGTPHKHAWTGKPEGLAEHIFTRLYGRPRPEEPLSPVAQAEDAKRRRDIVGEVGALMAAGSALESAPWYPVRPGDLVHIAYEAAGDTPASGETYIVDETSGPGDVPPGLMSLHLLAVSPGVPPEQAQFAGPFATEAADCPIYELWFEAGPHRLTIVRDGQVVHDGPSRSLGAAAAAGALTSARDLAAAAADAVRYLEHGEPELARARLRSHKPLPPCGAPGITVGQADCARPRGHRPPCSPDADYISEPHECPALPQQLHAVVTVGARVTDVGIEGLYEEREAAVDHASGFTYSEELTGRHVTPMPHGGTVVLLPQPKDAHGVQLAVVVPLPVLPDPRAADEWAAEGMATALGPEDYADDFQDVDE
ncbi:hypothetical protein AB0D74_48465 [Streptomyces sp. NPDC048278]|uniref:hypothetical protein n=1 Tax=Streptomyces sp. NPDC048278 TaxID=3155809 RepID=UPI003423865D